MEEGIITQEYAEAFGLEATQEPEAAETPETPETAGEAREGPQKPENGQEGAGDTRDTTPPAQEASQTPESEQGGQAAAPRRREMDPEERHRQAAARRERERTEAEAALQKRFDALYRDVFSGQIDPFTGKGITTEAEFRAFQARQSSDAQARQLKEAGIDPEAVRGLVAQELLPLRQELMRAQLREARERAAAANAQAQEAITASLKNIGAVYPEIKTLEDIAALDTAEEFNRLVQLGNSLEDAFYLANRREIEGRKIAAAKQSAVNAQAGKRHLDPLPAGGGQEAVEVPREQRDAYREIMPEATEAEIRAAYARYLKDIQKG